jgi:3,4-dihydroxy 2-butanone 4-phosphate synthase/GTP cyclohydrolase II
VICEILKEDGSMARLGDLVEFAREHGLKIGTIADLIHYRSRHETLVERTLSKTVQSATANSPCTRIPTARRTKFTSS